MKTRAKIWLATAAVALCATLYTLEGNAPVVGAADQQPAPKAPAIESLPGRCAIIATLAASELQKAGVWTRIIFIEFIDPQQPKAGILGHALTVWQPPTSTKICIYDDNGTFDLDTSERDAAAIARAFMEKSGLVVLRAKFLE